MMLAFACQMGDNATEADSGRRSMSYRYLHFVHSHRTLKPSDLIDFLKYDFDFVDDHSPRFEPLGEANGSDGIVVRYDGNDGLLHITIDTTTVESRLIELLHNVVPDWKLPPSLTARLKGSQAIVTISPQSEPPKDVWKTLGALDQFLQREWESVLFNNKGFYDADWRQLAGAPTERS